MKRTFLSSYINHMFEKGPGVYHCLVRKIAKKRKDNGVIMTGNVWIEFGTYLNIRWQSATWWYMQTQRNVCGSSVYLNIEKCFAANYFSFSADKLWPSCQLLKLWYPPQSEQMGCICSGISQETSYFGITAKRHYRRTVMVCNHRADPHRIADHSQEQNSSFTLCLQTPPSVWPIPKWHLNLAVISKRANMNLRFNQELHCDGIISIVGLDDAVD